MINCGWLVVYMGWDDRRQRGLTLSVIRTRTQRLTSTKHSHSQYAATILQCLSVQLMEIKCTLHTHQHQQPHFKHFKRFALNKSVSKHQQSKWLLIITQNLSNIYIIVLRVDGWIFPWYIFIYLIQNYLVHGDRNLFLWLIVVITCGTFRQIYPVTL